MAGMSREDTIPSNTFAHLVGTKLVTVDTNNCILTMEPGAAWWRKATPTLVLFPPRDELTADGLPDAAFRAAGSETPGEVKTLLNASGFQFEEAPIDTHGKALLLNFYSPSLEVYPKDKPECEKIYDMVKTTADEIPNAALSSVETLGAALQPLLVSSGLPVPSHLNERTPALLEKMVNHQKALGRQQQTWHVAWNKKNVRVIAHKLTRADLELMLQSLDRRFTPGQRLYREETYGSYEFGEGDYVLVDLKETIGDKHQLKQDKENRFLVRTVNEAAFEGTYIPSTHELF